MPAGAFTQNLNPELAIESTPLESANYSISKSSLTSQHVTQAPHLPAVEHASSPQTAAPEPAVTACTVRLCSACSVRLCPCRRMSLERLIRRLLSMPNRPAVVLVNTFTWAGEYMEPWTLGFEA